MIKYTRINGTETFEEVCEHCGEVSRTLHISDIITKKKNDPRALVVKDRNGRDKVVEGKEEYINNRRDDWERKGLLDQGEVPKYRTRPESLCSESIDTVAGTTSSFCYRVTNDRFLTKFSSSFHDSNEVDTNATGSKVGIDRNGNVIRMRAIKNIDMDTGIPEADSNIKYKGPLETTWFRKASSSDQARYIKGAQACRPYVNLYGKEVENMTVVARYKDAKSFIAAVSINKGCKI